MGILKFLFHFFVFGFIYASDDCQFSWCSDNRILIRFPFQLEGEQPGPYCGYPGFKLICTNDSKTILKLPHAGEFYVRDINYPRQQIQVYDPDGCLPKRFLSLNLSDSPFVAIFQRNYTLLSCPYQNTGSQFIPIDCLSNSTSFVSAVPSVNSANSLPESCYVIRRLSVPIGSPVGYMENFGDELSEDLRLTWHTPDCRDCESRESACGFESGNSDRVRCFTNDQTGNSHDGLLVFRIVTLSVAGAAVISALGMACFVCLERRNTTRRLAAAQRPATAATSPQPAVATMGLDESTIESYGKLVLGESRRLPGPNDGSCSICLSEYNSEETIRCIPKCKHCFHAACIDEWLRMNSTCPICRNSSSPSPFHAMSSDP